MSMATVTVKCGIVLTLSVSRRAMTRRMRLSCLTAVCRGRVGRRGARWLGRRRLGDGSGKCLDLRWCFGRSRHGGTGGTHVTFDDAATWTRAGQAARIDAHLRRESTGARADSQPTRGFSRRVRRRCGLDGCLDLYRRLGCDRCRRRGCRRSRRRRDCGGRRCIHGVGDRPRPPRRSRR